MKKKRKPRQKAKPEDIILRPVRLADAKRNVKWMNDPKIHKHISHQDLDLRKEKREIEKNRENEAKKVMAISYQGKHIGNIELRHIDQKNRQAELGIFIGNRKFWNRGIGTAATEKIVDYGFKKLKLHRIYLHVISYNKKAVHLYQKLGFEKEGLLKDNTRKGRKYYDDILMAKINK